MASTTTTTTNVIDNPLNPLFIHSSIIRTMPVSTFLMGATIPYDVALWPWSCLSRTSLASSMIHYLILQPMIHFLVYGTVLTTWFFFFFGCSTQSIEIWRPQFSISILSILFGHIFITVFLPQIVHISLI